MTGGDSQITDDGTTGGIPGTLQADGHVYLGSSFADNLTLLGQVNSDIDPDLSQTYDLGSHTQRWRDVYARRFNTSTSNSFEKFLLYGSSPSYAIGFVSGQSFGFLTDWATTFTMSAHDNRGWLWRDTNDIPSDGAMSLTTDGRLYLKSTAALMGNVGIGTINPSEKLEVVGDIRVGRVAYNSARTHYFSIGDGAFFSARSSVPFETSYGDGGTFVSTGGSGVLVAPVHLPDGAVVTEFKVYFVDNSAGNFTALLLARGHAALGANLMAEVDTSDVTASSSIQSLTDNTVINQTIDNINRSYLVRVGSDNWPGTADLRITGVVVTYTIAEAE
jgi:hypothetical protein